MERQAKDGTFYTQVGPDQWAPVTRESKDGTVYKKVGLDQWTPMPSSASMNPESNEIGAAARNIVQGGTGGFADEIKGAIGSLTGQDNYKDIAMNASPAALAYNTLTTAINRAQDSESVSDFLSKYKDEYTRVRDSERESLAEDKKNHPVVSTVASLAGSVASPINKIAKGMSLAKGGAAIGGLTAYGNTEEEDLVGQVVDTALGTALGFGAGKVVDKVMPHVSKVSGQVGDKIKDAGQSVKEYLPRLRDNADEIVAAAKRQGVEVTPGMIFEGDKFHALEASLAKSPSLLNRLGKQIENANSKVKGALDDVLDEGTALSPYETGSQVKKSIQKSFSDRMDPISKQFDEIASHTKNIGVSKDGVNRVVKNIDKIDEVQLVKGTGLGVEGKVAQYSKMLENVQTVDQLKRVGTMLQSEMQAAQGPEKMVLGQILDKVRKLENRNIERAAIKVSQESTGAKPNAKGVFSKTATEKLAGAEAEGKQIARSLVDDFKSARAGYSNIQTDARELAKQTGLKGKNLREFNQSLDNLTPEEVSKKFFDTGDQGLLQYMKGRFPKEFDQLRRNKLSELTSKITSSSSGETMPQQFIKQINGLPKDVRKLLLNSDAKIQTADDVATLYKSLYSHRNFNPSGTGQANAFMDMFGATVKDIPRYALYKSMTNKTTGKAMDKVADYFVKAPQLAAVEKTNPGIIYLVTKNIHGTSSMPKAADRSEDNKGSIAGIRGETKWAIDGMAKIAERSEVFKDPERAEKILSSKAGKKLLVQASDLKTNSKAMDRVIEQLESIDGVK